ncbi:MAG: hypothetical protein AAGA75_15560 [Cyanobacteria bacterium P01_E01_bin.6]
MLITKKSLKATDPAKLCLVITLEDGIKVQYPVVDAAEAIERYTDFLRTNSVEQDLEKQKIFVNSDTFSTFN